MSHRVLEVLEAEGSWVTAERVAMEAAMTDETAKRSLYRLKNNGQVETVFRDGRNLWRYVDGAIPDVDEDTTLPTAKTCSRCKESKSAREFGRNRTSKDGLTYYCKPCIKQRYEEKKQKQAAEPSEVPPVASLNGWRRVFADPSLTQLEQLRDLVGASSLDEAAGISRAIAASEDGR